jgi:hypothetical protein
MREGSSSDRNYCWSEWREKDLADRCGLFVYLKSPLGRWIARVGECLDCPMTRQFMISICGRLSSHNTK